MRNNFLFSDYYVNNGGRAMRRRKVNKGIVAITFAVGLLVSCFCPPRVLIAVLAIWVIILGCSCSKF